MPTTKQPRHSSRRSGASSRDANPRAKSAKPAARKVAKKPGKKSAAAPAKRAASAPAPRAAKAPARAPAKAAVKPAAPAVPAKAPPPAARAAAPARPAPKAPAAAPAVPAPSAAETAAANASGTTYLLLLSSHERRGRRFVQLKSPSVLAWFQRAWRLAREGRSLRGELGGEVHGLDALFDTIASRKLAVPATEVDLAAMLGKYLRAERDLETEPHFIHAETDDDEVEIEYFLFDDVFLESNEALDRLPSPERRARPQEDEPVEEEEFEVDDDDDPYNMLIAKVADR